MAEPLLTKDSINLGGHKFPIALIGGIAAVVGVLLVLRARKSGQNVAVGAQPNMGVNPAIDYGLGSTSPDYSAALANLSQQLTNLQNINGPTSAPAQQVQGYLAGSGNPFLQGGPYGRAQIPIYSGPGGVGTSIEGYLPFGTGIVPSGNAIQSIWGTDSIQNIPIALPGGVTGYVHSTDITPGLVNPTTAI